MKEDYETYEEFAARKYREYKNADADGKKRVLADFFKEYIKIVVIGVVIIFGVLLLCGIIWYIGSEIIPFPILAALLIARFFYFIFLKE